MPRAKCVKPASVIRPHIHAVELYTPAAHTRAAAPGSLHLPHSLCSKLPNTRWHLVGTRLWRSRWARLAWASAPRCSAAGWPIPVLSSSGAGSRSGCLSLELPASGDRLGLQQTEQISEPSQRVTGPRQRTGWSHSGPLQPRTLGPLTAAAENSGFHTHTHAREPCLVERKPYALALTLTIDSRAHTIGSATAGQSTPRRLAD